MEKRIYPYTLPSESPIGAVKVVPYAYTDANWKDKLTSYNGMAITYDTIGNPLSDRTWNYVWESGRQLKSMSKRGTLITYSYNVDGMRIRKTASGTVTDYTLHGKQVVHLKKGSDNLHFFYDAQARPAVVERNQGDGSFGLTAPPVYGNICRRCNYAKNSAEEKQERNLSHYIARDKQTDHIRR